MCHSNIYNKPLVHNCIVDKIQIRLLVGSGICRVNSGSSTAVFAMQQPTLFRCKKTKQASRRNSAKPAIYDNELATGIVLCHHGRSHAHYPAERPARHGQHQRIIVRSDHNNYNYRVCQRTLDCQAQTNCVKPLHIEAGGLNQAARSCFHRISTDESP